MSMKRIGVALILPLAIIGAVLFYRDTQNKKEIILLPTEQSVKSNVIPESEKIIEQKNISNFQSPLDHASERVTKKPFGILIDSKTSPV